jgi:uncharacterized protein (DUF302 family)
MVYRILEYVRSVERVNTTTSLARPCAIYVAHEPRRRCTHAMIKRTARITSSSIPSIEEQDAFDVD